MSSLAGGEGEFGYRVLEYLLGVVPLPLTLAEPGASVRLGFNRALEFYFAWWTPGSKDFVGIYKFFFDYKAERFFSGIPI